MEILRSRALSRPNVWGPVEVCEATVLVEPADLACHVGYLTERLCGLLPEYARLQAAPSPDVSLGEGAESVEILGRLMLALQSVSRDAPGRFRRIVPAGERRVFRMAVESADPALSTACLHQATAVVRTLCGGETPDIDAIRSQLVEHADEVCLGPSTMLIVRAAEDRGIPWRRLSDLSLVQLGHGRCQRRIWTAETDRTPAIAEAISRDKHLTKRLLDAAGVPVPDGRIVACPDEAWRAAVEIGLPVVVKPVDGNHGRGVFINLSTREEVEYAFSVARAEGRPGSPVLVEEFIPGVEHRLLVIGSRMVACARGEHLFVTGDGRRTVAELIEFQLNSDPRRGRTETLPNKTVEIDEAVRLQLAQEGVAPDTVPAAGRRVLVKRIGSHGCDVTDDVHPDVAATATRAARTIGLDIAGIDIVATDISRPMHEQGARVCEVNAGPQLLIHADPGTGISRPVGRDIVATLFGPGETGRIPIVMVLGLEETGIAAKIDALLRAAGRSPAVTSAGGKWVSGVRCTADDCSGVEAARGILVSPDIDVAIFELDWRAIARDGSPVDQVDVLVLGSFPDDVPSHGQNPGIDSPQAVVRAILTAVPNSGSIILVDAPAWAADILGGRKHLVVDADRVAEAAVTRLA